MDLLEGESGVIPARHWYYRSKAALLLDMLPAPFTRTRAIMDVGAGGGFFSRYLLERTAATVATCVDPNYPAETSEAVGGKQIRFVKRAADFDVDAVLFMDVIEHVEDDVALLRAYTTQVPAGTYVLITVPAFAFLWSAHDEYLRHYRRYTLDQLSRVAAAGGVRIERKRYFFGSIFPVAALVRLMRRENRTPSGSDLATPPAPINALLGAVCGAEVVLGRRNTAFGLTAVVVGRTERIDPSTNAR